MQFAFGVLSYVSSVAIMTLLLWAITCSVDKKDRYRYVTSKSRDLVTETDSSPPGPQRPHATRALVAA